MSDQHTQALQHKEGVNKFFELKQWKEAIEEYKKALSCLPNVPLTGEDNTLHKAVWANLAAAHLQTGEYEETVKHATAVLAIDSEHSKALYRRGKAYFELKNYSNAKKDLFKSEKLDPNNTPIVQEMKIRILKWEADQGARSRGAIPNPWFAHVSPSTPAVVATEYNEVLFQACKEGDVDKVQQCIGRGEFLNVTRGAYFETPLHTAVTSGNGALCRLLISSGAAVNSSDSRDNTPLYYAATHPGHNDCLANSEDKRCELIQILISAGGDTMRQGGFSGKRPFQQAATLGYARAAALIEHAPTNPVFQKIRSLINDGYVPEDFRMLVSDYRTVYWGLTTAGWFILSNRNNMNQCFQPMPELLAEFDGSLAKIEAMFIKYQKLFVAWWSAVQAKAAENPWL